MFGADGGLLGLGPPVTGNSLFAPIRPLLTQLEVGFVDMQLGAGSVSVSPTLSAPVLQWVDSTSPDQWLLGITHVSVGGNTTSHCTDAAPCTALLDSGAGYTVLLGLDDVTGALDVSPTCVNLASLPDVSFGLASSPLRFRVPASTYAWRMSATNCTTNLVIRDDDAAVRTALRRRWSAPIASAPFIVLGPSFFDAVRVVLDLSAHGRVGLAHK